MMKKEFQYRIYASILCLFLAQITFGQYTSERTSTDLINAEVGAELKIVNKYGNITIVGTDESEIVLKSTITVRKKSESEAKDLLDRINIRITELGKYIKVETEIAEKNPGFFAKLWSEVTIDFDKSDIQVDFEIQLPSQLDLDITNEFGDVVITTWTGKLISKMRHGDLHITEKCERANIQLEYGRINCFEIKSADIELKSARFKFVKIDDLVLNSHGSEIEGEQIGMLNITSNKDEIRAENIGRIKGNIRFGNAFINIVENDIYLVLKVTDLRISKLLDPSPSIYIEQENSEVDINISGATFSLDADMEGGIFRLPDNINDLDSKVIDSKSNHRKITANYGNPATGKISILGKKGFVIFRAL